jgi:hypothetical protein
MQKFMKNYSTYVDLLTDNDYVLALPSSKILHEIILDELFILNHILQYSYDGKEFTTLNGKTYHIKDKKLELASDPSIRVDILSNDVCYTESSPATKHFKRIIISNSLDYRFYIATVESNQP